MCDNLFFIQLVIRRVSSVVELKMAVDVVFIHPGNSTI